MDKISWQWLDSTKTMRVCAALAWYHTRLALIDYLLKYMDESEYESLQIVSSKDVIILIGREDQLPWIDGIQYAGYDDAEPRLWYPSNKRPTVPLPLLADSLCQGYQHIPLLIWDTPKVIIPTNKKQIVDKTLLYALASQSGNYEQK